jgi:methylmalonyl-CoA/ethylmalonyl-CoA epimerase
MSLPRDLDLPLVRGATLDHVAIAVRDPGPAAQLFRDILGGRFLMGADSASQGFRFVQYRFPGGGKVELVTPIAEGSFVSRFLDRRGEGMHHITLKVRGIEAQIERLRGGGVEPVLVDLTDDTWKEAFIHPSRAHGVLIQLAESPFPDDEVARHLAERFPEAALLSLG